MASSYFGNTLTDLQRGRTAAEEIAGRIAIQKLIQETAAQELAARRNEQASHLDLQRQQLAQQGQYQQGMLGRYNQEAISRAANELFDRDMGNRRLALEEKAVGFRDPTLTTPIQLQVLQAKAAEDEREKALIEQGLFLAAQNATGPLNQEKTLREKLFALDTLEPELARRIKEYDEAGWGWTSKAKATKRAEQEMMGQFPKDYTANTNIPFASNMTLARGLFNNQLADLAPITKGISPELMNRIQPTSTGYTARALFPMTSTTINGVPPGVLGNGMFTNTPSVTSTNAVAATNRVIVRTPDRVTTGTIPVQRVNEYLSRGYTLVP